MFKQMGALLTGASTSEGAPDMSGLFDSMKSSADLCPGAHAYAVTCGLGLAHMDAHLRANRQAAALLAQHLKQVMAARGIDVEQL